jgi:hypothetical protein
MSNSLRLLPILGLALFISFGYTSLGYCTELQEAIAAGKVEYMRSCALCHGDVGKGNGVYASKLTVRPVNLTLLQQRNNGVFPSRKIFKTIEGRDDLKLHGPSAMPVWGDRFDYESVLYVDDRFKRTFVRGRIFELILYLEEIQVQ